MKTKQTKNCIVCQKNFQKVVTCSQTDWENRKFCSRSCMNEYWIGKPNGRKKQGSKNSVPAWNKGIPLTEETKLKLSKKLKIVAKEKGYGLWMTGKKSSTETRKKQREANMKRIESGKHNWYIDGRTPENVKIRHSSEYRDWRIAVFRRDNYTCQECGNHGVKLNADHIKPFAYYPELRLVIENGRTLCIPCHEKTETFKGRAVRFKQRTL